MPALTLPTVYDNRLVSVATADLKLAGIAQFVSTKIPPTQGGDYIAVINGDNTSPGLMAAHNLNGHGDRHRETANAALKHGHNLTATADGVSATSAWAYVLEVDGEITTIPFLEGPSDGE